MDKSIEIRALEALVSELDKTIARLDKEILEKLEDAALERTRTSTLIEVFQKVFPKDARNIIIGAAMQLKKNGDINCDLLDYYDASYEE
jgi:hypothetical protein